MSVRRLYVIVAFLPESLGGLATRPERTYRCMTEEEGPSGTERWLVDLDFLSWESATLAVANMRFDGADAPVVRFQYRKYDDVFRIVDADGHRVVGYAAILPTSRLPDVDTTSLMAARDKVDALCKAECIETFGVVATVDNESREIGADINVYVRDPEAAEFRLPKKVDGFPIKCHLAGSPGP